MVMGDTNTERISIQCDKQGCTVNTPFVNNLRTSIAVAGDTVTLAPRPTEGDIMTIQFTDQVCSMDNDALNTAAARQYFHKEVELGDNTEGCMPIIKAMASGVSNYVENATRGDMEILNDCEYPECQVLQAGYEEACSNGQTSVSLANSVVKKYDWKCPLQV